MRHRIEHAYYPPLPGQLTRMRDLGLVWSTQPAEIDEVGEDWIRVFTRDRLAGLMPLRSALDLGVPTVINSDYPVTSIDPLVGIRAAVTRRTAAGTVLDPEQAVSVTEALRMMTTGPAYIEGAEADKGSLEPGKLADIVILSRDPLADPADTLEGIDVTTTIVGGSIRYSREFEAKEAAR
jgi:predicted amidohydrolase YtcJ